MSSRGKVGGALAGIKQLQDAQSGMYELSYQFRKMEEKQITEDKKRAERAALLNSLVSLGSTVASNLATRQNVLKGAQAADVAASGQATATMQKVAASETASLSNGSFVGPPAPNTSVTVGRPIENVMSGFSEQYKLNESLFEKLGLVTPNMDSRTRSGYSVRGLEFIGRAAGDPEKLKQALEISRYFNIFG